MVCGETVQHRTMLNSFSITGSNYWGLTLADDRCIFTVSTVVYSHSIVDAVRESRFVAKTVDIVEVDWKAGVGNVESGTRESAQCSLKSWVEHYVCAYVCMCTCV